MSDENIPLYYSVKIGVLGISAKLQPQWATIINWCSLGPFSNICFLVVVCLFVLRKIFFFWFVNCIFRLCKLALWSRSQKFMMIELIFSDFIRLSNMEMPTLLILPAVRQNLFLNIWRLIGANIWYLASLCFCPLNSFLSCPLLPCKALNRLFWPKGFSEATAFINNAVSLASFFADSFFIKRRKHLCGVIYAYFMLECCCHFCSLWCLGYGFYTKSNYKQMSSPLTVEY